LQKKSGLRELVFRAKGGDMEALIQLLCCLYPLVKKYGRQLSYVGACSDLILWLLYAVSHYQS